MSKPNTTPEANRLFKVSGPHTDAHINANHTSAQHFNANYPPGTPVCLINDDGLAELTKTRSEAWLLGSGDPVVMVKGRAGGYLLDRIHPIIKDHEE